MSWFTNLFRPKPTAIQSPSCSLTREQAGQLASIVANQLRVAGRDVEVSAVSNTNSMLPAIDSNCWLVLEKCPFEQLESGDAVCYTSGDKLILHALGDKDGNRFWTKGWNNARHDSVWITYHNFHSRLVAIFYSQHSPTSRL